MSRDGTGHSGDTESRRKSVRAAANKPRPDASIFEGLSDPDWRVRKEAVGVALEIATSHDLLPRLVEAVCQGENVGLRNAALEVVAGIGAAAVPTLLEALTQAPAGARKFLLEALGDTRDVAAVPALVAAARSDDANEAAAAIDALSRVGGADAEEALRDRLAANDPYQRMAALDGLARLGARVPWEVLGPLLDDRLVRRVALPLLGRTGSVSAVMPLVEALGEPSFHVVGRVVQALVELYDQGAATASATALACEQLGAPGRAALHRCLLDGDSDTRRAAALLGVLARDEDALEGLVRVVADGLLSPETASALREWGPAACVSLLDVHRRAEGASRAVALELAADLLASVEQPDPTLVDPLRAAARRALAASDPVIASAGARSLEPFATEGDAERLVHAARDADGDLALACEGALVALGAREPTAVRAALEGFAFEGLAGASLVRVLVGLGRDAGVVAQLSSALGADAAEVRAAAIEALAELGGDVELLAFGLADEDVDVQTRAARALGRLRDADGRPLGTAQLLVALDGGSSAVRAAAARALGESGATEAADALLAHLRSPMPDVAAAALWALRQLGTHQPEALLLEALGHDDPEVVKQALLTLASEEGERLESRLSLALAHRRWDVRALAARLLAEHPTEEARRVARGALEQEGDPTVRQALELLLAGGRTL